MGGVDIGAAALHAHDRYRHLVAKDLSRSTMKGGGVEKI